MRTIDQWGPSATGLDLGERLASLRSLRALARVLAGPRAAALCNLLRLAETDGAELVRAADALNGLAPFDRRRVLASYAVLARQLPPARGVKGRATFPRSVTRVTPRPGGPHQGWNYQNAVAAVA